MMDVKIGKGKIDFFSRVKSIQMHLVDILLQKQKVHNISVVDLNGGEGEIRTLAPVTRPTPLAGAPLRPT